LPSRSRALPHWSPSPAHLPRAPVESASGGAHWTIPLPNAFGVEVVNRTLAFNAREYAYGSVSGCAGVQTGYNGTHSPKLAGCAY